MEKNYKIESMVELRAFAITKAIECLQEGWDEETLYETANIIAEFIKGNAELPEVKEENDKILYEQLIKMLEENRNREQQRLDNILDLQQSKEKEKRKLWEELNNVNS